MKKLLILFVLFISFSSACFAEETVNLYTRVHAEHILVANKRQAKALLVRIKNGESFEKLAKIYSLCPSGRLGGDLGYFERGKMVKEFEDVAFELPAGQVSKPVETDFGWHLIKVIDKQY